MNAIATAVAEERVRCLRLIGGAMDIFASDPDDTQQRNIRAVLIRVAREIMHPRPVPEVHRDIPELAG